MFDFKIKKTDTKTSARIGEVKTAHGKFTTPSFMPVGTLGSVKTISPEELKEAGAEIILANAYHLYLRPGKKVVKKLGGLHKWMNWSGPILTDSGGYQVFSLGSGARGQKSLVKINEKGVEFKSHLDGSKHLFTPEKVVDIQLDLGADIIMPLDYCPSANASKFEISRAVNLTNEWFDRAWHHFKSKKKKQRPALFAIVQGGPYRDLRKKSFDSLSDFNPDGFSIGGVANAGESKLKQTKALDYTMPLLPEDKPRYLMGVGEPPDILNAIEKGIDMFDCVAPTRMARNGAVWTKFGRINLRNKKYIVQKGPIEKDCSCYACQNFSGSYIAHLIRENEVLGIRLTTIHNLHFIFDLIEQSRKAIGNGTFVSFKNKFLRDFKTNL